MRSRSAVSVLAGLGAVTLIGTVGVHPVLADETPTPTATVSDTPTDTPTTDTPTTDPPATQEPTDPPTSDPPTDPPTSDPPTDPPTSDPPTDPPTSDPPTGEPTDPPTGTPTDPPTGTPTTPPPTRPGEPKTPVLSLALTVSEATMRPGGSITATVRVASANATATGTVLKMSASGATVSPGTQNLGSVGAGGAAAIATVRAPSTAKPGVITVRAAVSAAKARSVSRSYKLIITSPSGALPPGISPTRFPTGVPALTPPAFDPLAGMKGPQVALPPIAPATPQIAPASGPLVPVSNLSRLPAEPFTIAEMAALQAGFLAALGAAVTLLLLRLRLIRRTEARMQRVTRRRLRAARTRLAGKRPTAARLRTLPPQPARVRPPRPLQPVPPIRLYVTQVRTARP
ncbi:hypothetical protein [Actinomadura bangladeshensis]|uniref:hypothetical protein n=1 Tax=Actinomadura bangladeshensis TaxID=453573 RepID=UPI001A9EB936|nr:hypothetical protein [Actinomadura bangladeshensis]